MSVRHDAEQPTGAHVPALDGLGGLALLLGQMVSTSTTSVMPNSSAPSCCR